MSNVVYGSNGIYAELVDYSYAENQPNNEIMTVSVKYGLIVHAEFLRHRLLSRGVKSNRAIPMKKIRKEVLQDPYIPVWFGAAQKGMSADNEMSLKSLGRFVWKTSRYAACGAHWLAEKLGAHKEWANRLLNPWQWVRETITATEWDNLYNLRIHPDAQKDIREIVECIYKIQTTNSPKMLKVDEWHTPYVITRRDSSGNLHYYDNDLTELSVEQAIKCSASRCARSSYDNHDGTNANIAKDIPLYNKLIDSDPKHASPVEHQATPMALPDHEISSSLRDIFSWNIGTTHVDSKYQGWSGNLKGFVQYRQLIDNNACWNFVNSEEV